MKLYLHIIVALAFLGVAVWRIKEAFTWIPYGTFNFVVGSVNLFLFGHRVWILHRIVTDVKEMKKLLKK